MLFTIATGTDWPHLPSYLAEAMLALVKHCYGMCLVCNTTKLNQFTGLLRIVNWETMPELSRTVNKPLGLTQTIVKHMDEWGTPCISIFSVNRTLLLVLTCAMVCRYDLRQWLCSLTARLALASLNKHTEAVSYYKKALELDPENDTYKSNLKIAEQKMKETPSPVGSCDM